MGSWDTFTKCRCCRLNGRRTPASSWTGREHRERMSHPPSDISYDWPPRGEDERGTSHYDGELQKPKRRRAGKRKWPWPRWIDRVAAILAILTFFGITAAENLGPSSEPRSCTHGQTETREETKELRVGAVSITTHVVNTSSKTTRYPFDAHSRECSGLTPPSSTAVSVQAVRRVRDSSQRHPPGR